MPLTLENLDDLTIAPADIGTPTRLDADVTVSSDYHIGKLTITGLLAGDALSFDPASTVSLVPDLGSLYLVYIGATNVATVSVPTNAANGYTFWLNSASAAQVETLIEALTFSTTVAPDSPQTAVRNLNVSLFNADAEEVSVGMIITIGEPDTGMTLDGFDDRIISAAEARSPVLLDSDVDFSITTASLAAGVTVTVSGFAPHDVPGISTGAGSPFSLQGNLLFHGSGDQPDQVGQISLGDGSMTIALSDNPTPARIEALIEALTIANPTGAGPLSRTITITITDSDGVAQSQGATVRLVPEIASLADTAVFFAGSEPEWQRLDTLVTLGSDPGSTSGGSLTISGLATLDEIGLDAPAGSTITRSGTALLLGSTQVGTVIRSGDTVTFAFSTGIGHGNIDTILSSLTFRNIDTDPPATRDLTFTVVNAAGETVAIDRMTVDYATVGLTDVAATATIRSGGAPAVLDPDVTLTIPEGLAFTDSVYIQARGVSIYGDRMTLSPAAESGLTLVGQAVMFEGVQVGTLIRDGAVEVEFVFGAPRTVLQPLRVQLNAAADAAAVEAIIEAISLSTAASPTAPARSVAVELLYRPPGGLFSTLGSATIAVTVSPPAIDGLDDSVPYALGNAPRVLDSALTLPDMPYAGVTITISGLEPGDSLRPIVGPGNTATFLTGPTPDSGSIARLGGFGPPVEIGSWSRANSAELVMTFSGSSVQTATVESLIEALGFQTTNPAPERVLTYTLSNGSGVIAQDAITVTVVAPIEVNGLVQTLRIDTADAAGLTVIDSDVTLVATGKDFGGGTLRVTSEAMGDELALIQGNSLQLVNIGLPDPAIFVRGGIWIGNFKVLDGGFEITFTESATAAHVEMLLENIGFSAHGTPPVPSRDITLRLTDADGTRATETVRINVLAPTEQALDYVVLTADGTMAASGLAQDLDPAGLFEGVSAPDNFTVRYSGLFEVGALQPDQQVFFDWTGPAGTVLRVNGVEVASGTGMPTLLTLAPGLHRIDFVVPHSAQGGSVTSAVPGLLITQGYGGSPAPQPSAPYQPLLSAARATPALIYRVDATIVSTEVLQQPPTTYERTVFVLSPDDVDEAVLAVLSALPFGSSTATAVTRTIITPIRVGTAGNDTLGGLTGEDSVIEGGYGDDLFLGGAGVDTLDGGAGVDTLSYAASASGVSVNLQTGAGDRGDVLISIERVIGSSRADTLGGGDGDDLFWGGAGHDTVSAGAGNDQVVAGRGSDLVNGDDGDDTLSGHADDDSLFGGNGNDNLSGGGGDDLMSGGAGHDTLRGGDGDDVLIGGGDPDLLFGGDGADTLQGGTGNDTLHGDAGDDALVAGAGDDVATGGDGKDLIDGGAGADTLFGREGDDILIGGTDADALSGGSGADQLIGGDGNDTLAGGKGADRLDGGLGADVFVFDRSDLRSGIDQIAGFVSGEDRIGITADLALFVQSRGGSLADAIAWTGETGMLSLNLAAVGMTGQIDLARVTPAGGTLTLTMDDIVLL